MTKPKVNPSDFAPESVQAQIEAFFAKGRKPQQIAFGVQAEVLRDRRGMNELTAKHALGGKKGGANRKGTKNKQPIELETEDE